MAHYPADSGIADRLNMPASFFHEGNRRYQAALQGLPDRVPVFAQMHEFVSHELKIEPTKFYSTPELLINGTLDVMASYGIDVPVLDYDVYNIEAEALGQNIICLSTGMPDIDRTKPLIRDRGDLNKIRRPVFESQGRFPMVLEMNRLFQERTGGLDGTPGFCAPFSLAANIRGIESLLMDIYTDPDFARALFDRITDEVVIPWIMTLKETCPTAGGICGSDAWTSIPIVNTQIITDWILPYIKRIQSACGPQVYVPNWVGESLLKAPLDMLDLKIQACPGFVEGQDPDVETLGPSFYRMYADKHELPLILGLGAAFLALATPDKIRRRVRDYIQHGGKNGRLIFYLCNLGATTPPENVKAVVQAIREYGTY